jgi:hypothetical protein
LEHRLLEQQLLRHLRRLHVLRHHLCLLRGHQMLVRAAFALIVSTAAAAALSGAAGRRKVQFLVHTAVMVMMRILRRGGIVALLLLLSLEGSCRTLLLLRLLLMVREMHVSLRGSGVITCTRQPAGHVDPRAVVGPWTGLARLAVLVLGGVFVVRGIVVCTTTSGRGRLLRLLALLTNKLLLLLLLCLFLSIVMLMVLLLFALSSIQYALFVQMVLVRQRHPLQRRTGWTHAEVHRTFRMCMCMMVTMMRMRMCMGMDMGVVVVLLHDASLGERGQVRQAVMAVRVTHQLRTV